MAASRAARKREMIANLANEEYLNDLVNESYAIIFTQSTTNTVAQKKVKKAFEAGGCHIGTKDKHASWKAGNGDFQTVDAFLESDNSAGTVRDQLALYTLFLMFDTVSRVGEVPPASALQLVPYQGPGRDKARTLVHSSVSPPGYPASRSPYTGSELLPTHHSLRLAGSWLPSLSLAYYHLIPTRA